MSYSNKMNKSANISAKTFNAPSTTSQRRNSNSSSNGSLNGSTSSSSSESTSHIVIPLIDPTMQSGLIEIPISKTQDTKGRAEWLRGSLHKELSLCCLYQKGRCFANDGCHQIHVDHAFMSALRQQQAHIISCCRDCKDTGSLTVNAMSFFASHFGGSNVAISDARKAPYVISTTKLAHTTGLQSFANEVSGGDENCPIDVIPFNKVCRLHLKAFCKYGKDCKNIHMCSKIGTDILNYFMGADAQSHTNNSRFGSQPTFEKREYVKPQQQAKTAGSFMDRFSEAPVASTKQEQPVKKQFSTMRTTLVAPAQQQQGLTPICGSVSPVEALGIGAVIRQNTSPLTVANLQAVTNDHKKKEMSIRSASGFDVSIQLTGLQFDLDMLAPQQQIKPSKNLTMDTQWLSNWDDELSCYGGASSTRSTQTAQSTWSSQKQAAERRSIW